MKRLLVAFALAVVLLGAGSTGAGAASPGDAARQKAVIDQIRAQLGSNLADAMAAQQQLKQSLIENTNQQHDVQGQIADAQQQIDDLDVQIAASAASRSAASTVWSRSTSTSESPPPVSVPVVPLTGHVRPASAEAQ